MNQICTTKEQSSRLLEAGIRPDTADMVILYIDEECNVAGWKDIRKDDKGQLYYDVYGETYILRKEILPVDNPYYDHSYQNDCPAWSLSALIDMIPDQIECEGYNYYLFILPRDKEFTVKYSAGSNLAQSYCRESLFDAITEMIEWLIKEGYLDKKFLTDKCGDCRLIENEDANGEAWCSLHQKPVRCDSEACKDILEKGGNDDHT